MTTRVGATEGCASTLRVASAPGVTGSRLEKLRSVMEDHGLAGVLITSPANVCYLGADLAIGPQQALIVTADSIYGCDPAATETSFLTEELGVDRREIADGRSEKSDGHELDRRDLSAVLAAMRRIKDDAEVAAISEAAACVDCGIEAARATVRAGVADAAVVEAARLAMRERTSSPIAFAYNIGVGMAGADPDATCSGALVAPGDAVFLDIYPRIGAYYADATRTFFAGTPPRHSLEIVRALWAALDAGASMLRPGMRAADVDKRCREELEARGVRADYPHHTGHGVGLEQQEPPWLTPASTDVLVAGDVIALEPGFYTPALGARVEELYIVREDGPQLISHASRSPWGGGDHGN